MGSHSTGYVFVCFFALVWLNEITCGDKEEQWPPAPAPAPTMTAATVCSSRVDIYGYPCEEHSVITEDGYILAMQRIPAGRSGSQGVVGDRTPILLQHGLLMDGVAWLLNSPDQSLGFILADNGFDVWIANTRGTVHSRGHAWLAADDPAYWDWSWDELKEYDLPAMVTYVHRQTGRRLNYVGHSLGTLLALTSFSQKKLVNMVRAAGLLCPIAYVGQITSTLVHGAAHSFAAEAIYWMNMSEFNPKGSATDKLLKSVCERPSVDCYDLLSSLTGQNCCLNSSSIGIFLQYEPQPTATKNMVHLAQMTRSGSISKYDYGKLGNMMHYGHLNPPSYDMSGIPADIPLFLSYGGLDEISDTKDVVRLLEILKSQGVEDNVHYLENYAHMDFIMGVNAKQDVYDPLMSFFSHQ